MHVEQRWQQQALALYVTDHPPGTKPRVLRVVSALDEGDFAVQWQEYDPNHHNADLGPTLVLPMQVAEAVVEALGDYLPPDAAQGEHLKDAIQVRDRLLALVERSGA